MLESSNILAEGLADPQTLLLLGIVIVLGSLFMMRRNSRAKRNSRVDGRTSQHAATHNLRLGQQARDDINELMVRLEELSREICGQIDTRFAKLETVLEESKQVLAALRAACASAGASAGTTKSAEDHTPPAEPRPRPFPPADPRHVEVFERAERGQANTDIAREMNMSIGEVALVLSLERSRRSFGEQVFDEPTVSDAPPKTEKATKPPKKTASRGKAKARPSRTSRLDKKA